ncbi:membrane-targeted effector domain-containing toxin [Pseudomonas sp. GL93]|uniref:membrane-targeted effector domain-containing toxin n=1 Tax=Pseudomonas sp. GL93 TaxID=2014741 RepID=UPI0010584C87|nr:membrane-targeted effector domain-containing toxin [Pseudomonas sp. GL93]
MFAPASSTVQRPLDQHHTFAPPAETPPPQGKSQTAPRAAPSTYAPDDLPLPDSPSTPPATVLPSRTVSLIEQHNEATHSIQELYKEQPNFKTFLRQQLATLFPDQPHLNAADLTFKRWRKQDDGSIKTLSVEPLLDELNKEIQEQLRNPGKKAGEDNNVHVGLFTQGSAGVPPTLINSAHSLHTIAQRIIQYATAQQTFWTTPRQSPQNPQVRTTPQNELLALHKRQLATLAAARANDGTLSPASKQLIDTALQYPTLAERENTFADGARPGVYPLTVDDGTERGALLAGTFLITQTDGSFATEPTWPKGRSLSLGDSHGPVVLYTPGEGFEEFATPAQARAALAKRLDQGGVNAELLLQTLPLALQNRAEQPSGDDLTLRIEPLTADVLAEGIPWMLKRQQEEINKQLTETLTAATPGNPLTDPTSTQAIDDAADWSYQLDSSNALLAYHAKLIEKQQPEWLKNLTPAQEAIFLNLERSEKKSTDALLPRLQKIPSLSDFSRDRMNEAIKKLYPTAQIDADKLKVQIDETTIQDNSTDFLIADLAMSILGKHITTSSEQKHLSLTDLALKNPTGFLPRSVKKTTTLTLTLPLVDIKGNPIPDSNGKPIILNDEQLKALINTADVGGQYDKLLKKELAPDAPSDLREAWKSNLSDAMEKDAFLAQLSPTAYKEQAAEDKSSKRAAQWVTAILDHPNPANRPKVDGQSIIANALLDYGQPIHGVLVIGNKVDSSLVLYTPKAPDGIAFREVADQKAMDALLKKDEWKAYIADRKSPVNKDDVAKRNEAIRDIPNNPFTVLSPDKVLDIAVKEIKVAFGGSVLKPIEGNVQDHLYQQNVQMIVDKADHQSVSSAQVAQQSFINKATFGVEVGMLFLDFLPGVGKAARTGTHLSKAALVALRTNRKLLPKLISKPGLAHTIHVDFALATAGIKGVRAAPLRPVFRSSTTTSAPVPRQGPSTSTGTPSAPSSASASTSSGVTTAATRPSTNAAIPNRDLSAYTVPNEVISGRPLRPDGTYNVGDNWYVRFTDSTGANGVYQIDSAFHARSGQVNIINPNAPATASRSSRTVASLQSAGNGEWRINQLPGGRRGRERKQMHEWPVNYTDYLLSGGLDMTAAGVNRRFATRWFREGANESYVNQALAPTPRPNMPAITPNASPGELARELLRTSNGIVFGEQHNQIATNVMLIKNMQAYADEGVTTLYLEGAEWNGFTGYTADEISRIPPQPRNRIYKPEVPTRENVLAAAQQHGIKIVGIEHEHLTMHSTRPFDDDVANLRHTTDRLRELNYFASKVIQQTPPGEKWIAVVGRRHMNTTQGVPGIAEQTGAISVGVYDATPGASSVAVKHTGPRPAPEERLAANATVGDYQVHQNVDPYLKTP